MLCLFKLDVLFKSYNRYLYILDIDNWSHMQFTYVIFFQYITELYFCQLIFLCCAKDFTVFMTDLQL